VLCNYSTSKERRSERSLDIVFEMEERLVVSRRRDSGCSCGESFLNEGLEQNRTHTHTHTHTLLPSILPPSLHPPSFPCVGAAVLLKLQKVKSSAEEEIKLSYETTVQIHIMNTGSYHRGAFAKGSDEGDVCLG